MINKPCKIIGIIFLCIFLVSCATVSQSATSFSHADVSNEGNALLYFYRVNNISGSIVSMEVIINRDEVGTLNQGAYITKELAPGSHQILVKAAGDGYSKSFLLEEEFLSGETYYIKISGFKLKIMSKSAGLKDIQSMKFEG